MTLDTQMTLALLQEMLIELGIEELGRDVAGEVESDWMVPLLIEAESNRLMVWHLQLIKAQQENWKSEVNQPLNLLP